MGLGRRQHAIDWQARPEGGRAQARAHGRCVVVVPPRDSRGNDDVPTGGRNQHCSRRHARNSRHRQATHRPGWRASREPRGLHTHPRRHCPPRCCQRRRQQQRRQRGARCSSDVERGRCRREHGAPTRHLALRAHPRRTCRQYPHRRWLHRHARRGQRRGRRRRGGDRGGRGEALQQRGSRGHRWQVTRRPYLQTSSNGRCNHTQRLRSKCQRHCE
mmetsp:Transcript_91136/g.292502  ORF Transcript_91136/g.292502 Transcript_91136/m.292502 type:complete len:216 (-) Transcript_91136:37-684(-)